jgi:hypothetical protein
MIENDSVASINAGSFGQPHLRQHAKTRPLPKFSTAANKQERYTGDDEGHELKKYPSWKGHAELPFHLPSTGLQPLLQRACAVVKRIQFPK